MSLIQEALRRKQEEQGMAPVSASVSVLPAPTKPDEETQGQRRFASTLVWSVRVLCYVVIVAGAGAGLVSLYRSFTPNEGGAPATTVATTAPVPEAAEAAEAAKTAAAPEKTRPEVTASAAASAWAPPRFTRAASPPPPAPAATPEWPKLQVMGVFARSDPSHSSAVIDGALQDVGADIDGAVLAEVRHNGVVFRLGDEERFVRVGKSTRD